MNEKQQGIVRMSCAVRRFGFIKPDAGGRDLFFHFRQCFQRCEPKAGDKVEYEVTMSQNEKHLGKPQAKNVRVLLSGVPQ